MASGLKHETAIRVLCAHSSAQVKRAERLFSPRALLRRAVWLLVLARVIFPLSEASADCGDVRSIKFLESARISDASQGLSEPSGLTLANGGRHLWTLSDNTSRVFLIGTDGDLKRKHTIETGLEDLEGVAFDPKANRLLVVSEADTEIVAIDLTDKSQQHFPLSNMVGYNTVRSLFEVGDRNDGLEGIAIDQDGGRIFLIKEKHPRALIEISLDLSEIRNLFFLSAAQGFVDDDEGDDKLDVSGLAYDSEMDCLWIISDRGKRLYLFDPKIGSARTYDLTWLHKGQVRNVPHAEGIAFEPMSGRLFVVNDNGKRSRLFTYQVERGSTDQ